ncbi:16S rRNA (cytosine(1402)-N(4))-methyltransferase RsmH [bacterium]|nr:16S rRNA (cytosine(1402)-N(4))-methyltransferase RsmH [bacterium]
MSEKYHYPAFIDEIVTYGNFNGNGIVFDLYGGDGTYGEVLLEKFPQLEYFHFDIDQKAIDTASKRLERFGKRVHIKKQSCMHLDKRILDEGLSEIGCAIYDPGLRLEYVTNPERGFSVKLTGPLDGRFDQTQAQTIGQVVNNAPVEELIAILKIIEVPFPKRIAIRIAEVRKENEISTTGELASIVSKAVPFKAKRKRVPPEILVMLALRIHVNDELNTLRVAVEKGFEALKKSGRLLTISYHSGEARIYKRFARLIDERYADDENKRLKVITRKALKPTDEAIRMNPLIRSAQFRVYEKLF